MKKILIVVTITLMALSFSARAVNVNRYMSGSWYNYAQDGHGLAIQVISPGMTLFAHRYLVVQNTPIISDNEITMAGTPYYVDTHEPVFTMFDVSGTISPEERLFASYIMGFQDDNVDVGDGNGIWMVFFTDDPRQLTMGLYLSRTP